MKKISAIGRAGYHLPEEGLEVTVFDITFDGGSYRRSMRAMKAAGAK